MTLRAKVRLEYEVDGQDRDVVATYSAVDLRAWETAFGDSALTSDMSVTMLTWLAHHAAVRQGLLDGELKSYKRFDEVCFSVEGADDEESPTEPGDEPKPRSTRRKAGAGSSAP